jgi:hypothetical protein
MALTLDDEHHVSEEVWEVDLKDAELVVPGVA